jgi:transcriptional antiterminator
MSESKSDYKIGRLIEKYSLDGVEDEFAAEWTRDDAERSSLRELADEFNRRILRVVLRDANINSHERDIENLYHVLTDDDVSSGVQVQSRRELEQEGVAIDEIESDFITYQAVYNFLQDYCDTTYQQPSDEEQLESDLERVNRLISRTRAVVESDLERLSQTGRIAIGEHDVFVDVQVYCQECDIQYSLSDLLTNGSCDCEA